MAKSQDAFRTISEVADWLETPAHVLRFWESRFTQVKPVKRAGGRRYYRPADMELLSGIKKLLHEDGMTIKGVQKLLRSEGIKHVAAMSQPMGDMGSGTGVKTQNAPVEAPLEAPVVEEVTNQVISFPPVQDPKEITPDTIPTETPEVPRQASFLDADPAFIAPTPSKETAPSSAPEMKESFDTAPPVDVNFPVAESVSEATEDPETLSEDLPLPMDAISNVFTDEESPAESETVSEFPVEIEESIESDLSVEVLPEASDSEDLVSALEDEPAQSEPTPHLAEDAENTPQPATSEDLTPSEPELETPSDDAAETVQESASTPDLVMPDPSEVPPIGGADDLAASIEENTNETILPSDTLDVVDPSADEQDPAIALDAQIDASPSVSEPLEVESETDTAHVPPHIEEPEPAPLPFISETPDDLQDDAEGFTAHPARHGLSTRAAPFSPQKKSELQALTLRLMALRKSYGDVSKGAPKN